MSKSFDDFIKQQKQQQSKPKGFGYRNNNQGGYNYNQAYGNVPTFQPEINNFNIKEDITKDSINNNTNIKDKGTTIKVIIPIIDITTVTTITIIITLTKVPPFQLQ